MVNYKIEVMHRGLPWAGTVSAASVVSGSKLPPSRGSPRTPRRSSRTRDRRWSLSPPTRSLHACDDDATLSISATTILNLRIHLLSHKASSNGQDTNYLSFSSNKVLSSTNKHLAL